MILTALKNKFHIGQRYTMQEAMALYTTNALSNLAISLIGIYLPIYIYELSLDYLVLNSDPILNALIWNCLFYLVVSITTVLTILLFISTIFSKLHLKSSLFLGIIFRAISIGFLQLATTNPYFLIASAVFWGFRITFYWIPYHIFFVRRADDGDHKYGAEASKRNFFSGIATALGPLLGGLMISNLGFEPLFIITIILMLVSSLPTLLYVRESTHGKHKAKDVFSKYLLNKKYMPTNLAFFGRVTSAVIFAIFWGILLFLKLDNFVEIGILSTTAGIFATVLLLVVGKIIDSEGKKTIHAVSVFINSALHISRIFLISPLSFYVNSISDQINASAYGTAFIAATYEKTSPEKASNFMVYRQLTLHLGRIVLFPILILLIVLTGSWWWVFIIGAIGSAMTYLINY